MVHYLGTMISPEAVRPQKLCIHTDHLTTLNDFQKLLGDIQWVRPYLHIPNCQLQPLYDILPGETDLHSPRHLTAEAKQALQLVKREIQTAAVRCRDPSQPITLCILQSPCQPTGVIWQGGLLLWVHPKISPAKTLEYYLTAVATLALLGIQQCIQHFGVSPQVIIVPYTKQQIEILSASLDDWAILRCSFPGTLDNHYPRDPLLHLASAHPVIFPRYHCICPTKQCPSHIHRWI